MKETPKIINDATVMVNVSDLAEHPRNPNRGDMERIGESIEADGFYGTIVAQKSTGHILVGNHRYRAAVELGLKTVPVTWVDIDDDQALRILVKDNRITEFGKRHTEALAELLKEIQAASSLAGTGYSEQDVEALFQQVKVGVGSNVPWTPAYHPQYDSSQYTERDLIQAEKNVQDSHLNTSRMLQQIGCPHCGYMFYIEEVKP